MNIIRKIVFVGILILSFNTILSAQSFSQKWLHILDEKDHSVYLDTTNLRHVENQITAVILSQYSKPIYIAAYDKDANSIKSQVLFNLATKRFTILGTLFYDSSLRIIGESTLPGFSLGNDAFSSPIDSNETMSAVYDKCIEILSIDTTQIVKQVKNDGDYIKLALKERKNANTESGEQDTENNLEENVVDNSKFIDKPVTNKKIERDSKRSNDDNINAKEHERNEEYDTANETNPVGMIFTDGNKYCFQLSSWRHESKAKRVVDKLKNKGYNAFVVKAYVPSKGGTWYRVRIGYFDSLAETKNYMKEVK